MAWGKSKPKRIAIDEAPITAFESLEPRRLLTTYTVTSNADSGVGSLRQAILDANASGVAGRIVFAIPGAGAQTINVASALPPIQQPLQIDGTTEPGFAGTPVINLVVAGNAFSGLTVTGNASATTIYSLAIGGFDAGVEVLGNATIAGCYIGLDASSSPLPNRNGVYVHGGGTANIGQAGDGNVISGNLQRGVYLADIASATVAGNLVGTDPAGLQAIPNPIGIEADHSGYLIGGSIAAARNIISGNSSAGIHAEAPEVSGSAFITGNYIGTDLSGEHSLPNAIGIDVENMYPGNGVIGGAGSLGNVISGNLGDGVTTAGGAGLRGNRIGITPSGRPLGNGGNGVTVRGGTGVGLRGFPSYSNIIAYNAAAGISETSALADVVINSIYNNGGLGVDIGNDGPSPSGIVISSASTVGSSTTVSGSFAGTKSKQHKLDFYSSPAADPSGFGEGKTYLGTYTFTTDASGNATFTNVALPTASAQFITAIADANTEFSAAVPVAGASSSITGRYAFYNASAYDNNDPSANAADDAAIDPTKSALLPGQTATAANFTDYWRGLNGVMFDVANLPDRSLTSADFTFKVGTTSDPSTWTTAPAPSAIQIRDAAGINGADRVTLLWPDNAIQNQWLQITINATAKTGLATPDVFYFGNLVGDVNGNGAVTGSDVSTVKAAVGSAATVGTSTDVNRNSLITGSDVSLVKLAVGASLPMISAPAPAPPPPAPLAAAASNQTTTEATTTTPKRPARAPALKLKLATDHVARIYPITVATLFKSLSPQFMRSAIWDRSLNDTQD